MTSVVVTYLRVSTALQTVENQRLGRPPEEVPLEKLHQVSGMSVRVGARHLGVARSTVQRWKSLARIIPSATR